MRETAEAADAGCPPGRRVDARHAFQGVQDHVQAQALGICRGHGGAAGDRLWGRGIHARHLHGTDKLYQKQHTAVTKAARLAALKQIQVRLATDVPGIELYVQKDLWLINNHVHGFEPQVLFGGKPLWLVALS